MNSAPLLSLLRERFGHAAFRPHQEDACRAVASGDDVLLVMPTGAGKSLVYQLPGLARNGVTVVVAPLLSLIEDQVQKLSGFGLRVARIHSGRPRDESREVCRRYLEGELDFLFVAPERLAVPGFIELLARRPIALLAIDEAHCISFWGHDFRPEYRMLGRRIEALRGAGGAHVPTPIVALTATATPDVQRDVMEQLRMRKPRLFVHGFRRDNLEIEAQRMPRRVRANALRAILAARERRPAIVYANSRKETEALAAALRPDVHAAPYHAGLPKPTRERVQSAFLRGTIDVVVATVAFGMGIDKPNVRTVIHAGMPANLEGYYQEIGRGGRDGLPTRAVLFHDTGDRMTHEFLLEKSYPAPPVLERIFTIVGQGPCFPDELAAHARMTDEELARVVDQLWIHGGVRFDARGAAVQGDTGYRESYERQRQHRFEQLEAMVDYTTGVRCRMATLVGHFGDTGDAARVCAICDVCRSAAVRGPTGVRRIPARPPWAPPAAVVGNDDRIGPLSLPRRLRDPRA